MAKMKSRGRPRDFDEETVLRDLVRLFWVKGYEGTSLQHIMAETGLKKGSLYSLFGSKKDMYMQALIFYNQGHVKSACQQLMDEASGQPLARLERFLTAPIISVSRDMDRSGCFLCNAAADMADKDNDVNNVVEKAHMALEAALMMALKSHDPSLNNVELLIKARSLLTTYTGLRILARTSKDISRLEAGRDAAMQFIGA